MGIDFFYFCDIILLMIKQFNNYHLILFGSIMGAFILMTLALFFLRRFKKTTYIIILTTLVTCLVLHFLRVFMPNEKETFRTAISFVAPATVCAISAIIFPFVFMSKSKFWKDYMFFVGPVTALMAMVVPIAQYDTKAMAFDTFRFFITHAIIAMMPIAMVICGHHKIKWNAFWVAPVGLLIVGCVIITNDIILISTGVLDGEIARYMEGCEDGTRTVMGYLLSPEYRNTIMFYGPNPVVGGLMERICNWATPEFMRTAPFNNATLGVAKGERMYWPLVWMLIPFLAFVLPIIALLSIACDPKGFWRAIRFKKLPKESDIKEVITEEIYEPREDGKLCKLRRTAAGDDVSLDDINI